MVSPKIQLHFFFLSGSCPLGLCRIKIKEKIKIRGLVCLLKYTCKASAAVLKPNVYANSSDDVDVVHQENVSMRCTIESETWTVLLTYLCESQVLWKSP